jgi:hypothetical protein
MPDVRRDKTLVIVEAKNEQRVYKELATLEGVESIIINAPARGAHLISEHLL